MLGKSWIVMILVLVQLHCYCSNIMEMNETLKLTLVAVMESLKRGKRSIFQFADLI